jgi:hypothetical protein
MAVESRRVPTPPTLSSQQLQEGLSVALLVPLRGEALGWTLGLGAYGLWLLFVCSFFGPFPLVGFLAVWGTVAIFYRLASQYFDACFHGARAGRLEPRESEIPKDPTLYKVVFEGLGIVAFILVLSMVATVVFLAIGGNMESQDLGDLLLEHILATIFSTFVPAGLALRAARGTTSSLFNFPRQLAIARAAGLRYLVPVAVSGFALSVPFAVLEWGYSAGYVSGAFFFVFACGAAGYVFGAMGAAMGWLANRIPAVARALD